MLKLTPAEHVTLAREVLQWLNPYAERDDESLPTLTELLLAIPRLCTDDGEAVLDLLAERGYIRVFEEGIEESDYRDFEFYIKNTLGAIEQHGGSLDGLTDAAREELLSKLQWPYFPVLRITQDGRGALADRAAFHLAEWNDAELAANVFRRWGSYWQVRFKGEPERPHPIKHSVGMVYIWHMLQQDRGRPVSALNLKRLVDGMAEARVKPKDIEQPDVDDRASHAAAKALDQDTIVDMKALADCHDQLVQLNADYDRAKEKQDEAGMDRIESERGFLSGYIRSATVKGRLKRLGVDDPKRASDATRAGLGRAYKRLADDGPPELAEWLRKAIITGRDVRYQPPEPIDWDCF